jgi:serine/threonine protein kinase
MYLHHQVPPIVHRDLKSLNLLVDETFKIKVADFGLSKDKNNDINTKMGTLNWVAPEILNDNSQPYTEKADLYSFGLVLWEILTNKTPYEGKTTLQIVRLIDMGERPKVPTDADPEFAKLIVDCWHSDPAKRPPIEAVFKRLQAIKARYDKAAQPSSTKQ